MVDEREVGDYGKKEDPSDEAAAKTGAQIPKSKVGDYGEEVEAETAEVKGGEFKPDDQGEGA